MTPSPGGMEGARQVVRNAVHLLLAYVVPRLFTVVSIVVADSYRPIDRGGLICAVAVFESTNPTDTAAVLAAMQTWVAAGPAGAQATVAQLSDTRVQLSACDPGADAAAVPQPGNVDALINRQLTRLAS